MVLSRIILSKRLRRQLSCLCPLLLAFSRMPAWGVDILPDALASTLSHSVFEVVVPKAGEKDFLAYAEPLPLELLPYSERTDPYSSIGTAFCVGPNRFLSAAHVFKLETESFAETWYIRDGEGVVREVDQVYKYSNRRDFILFSVKDPAGTEALEPAPATPLNSVVYTVGNALGEGVIIREGRYTSNTPEDRDGAWKWLRFTAPASPGNSGGPLIDASGRVLGIAEMRSENENYNYALPLDEVTEAPDIARLDSRYNYTLPVTTVTQLGFLDVTVSLPLSIPELRARLLAEIRANTSETLAALLRVNADSLFPRSEGSLYLLRTPRASFFPGFAVEQSDHTWKLDYGGDSTRSTIGVDGWFDWAPWKDMDIQHFSRPENADLRRLLSDSKYAMDMVLTGMSLARTVGGKEIRITSFGNPARESRFTDRWGRIWLETEWDIRFSGQTVHWYRLPTPDGFSAIMDIAPVGNNFDLTNDMHEMLSFMDTDYMGTYGQWREFLSLREYLPAMLTSMEIDASGPGVRAGGLSFVPPEKYFAVNESTMLYIYGSFKGNSDGGWAYDTQSIYAQTSGSESMGAGIQRILDPGTGLGKDRESQWANLAAGNSPYDGEPYEYEGKTYGYAVLPLESRVYVLGDTAPKASAACLASVYYSYKKPLAEAKAALRDLVSRSSVSDAVVADYYGVSLDSVIKAKPLAKIEGLTIFDALISGNSGVLSQFIDARVDLDAKDTLGRTPLTAALLAKDPLAVQSLLEGGADVDGPTFQGETALMRALRDFPVEVASSILDKGASIDTVEPSFGRNALHFALQFGKDSIASRLVDMGADRELRNKEGWSPLMLACRYKCPNTARKLLALGVDLEPKVLETGSNALILALSNSVANDVSVELAKKTSDIASQNESGFSPLLSALRNNNPDAAQILLDRGAEIDKTTKDGWSALMLAVRYSNAYIASKVLDRAPPLEAVTDDGWSALMLALRYDRPDAAKRIIEAGADVFRKNGSGWTPLMHAVRYSTPENVRLILARGADVNASNDQEGGSGWSPLVFLARYGPEDLLGDLLASGANVNHLNADKATPLLFACQYRGVDFIRKLIEAGADVSQGNAKGQTPLHKAIGRHLSAITVLLLDQGADPDARDADGVSPRNLAITKGYTDIVDILANR